MKISEFKKLIREEIRRVINEGKVISNVKAGVLPSNQPKVDKLFGSFIKVTQGPTKSADGFFLNYVVDLDTDALLNLLKSDKNYQVPSWAYEQMNLLQIYYKGSIPFEINAKNIPRDIALALVQAGKRQREIESLITIQISDPQDDFGVPDDYGIPIVAQSLVGKITYSGDSDDEEAYENDINRYVLKIEKVLLAAGKKIVPGLQKYTMEDGAIVFKSPKALDVQTQAKLKALYKGAKSIEF